MTLTVGWFNIEEETSFEEWNEITSVTKTVVVEPALYTFDDLKWLLESGESNVLLRATQRNGIVSLTVGAGWEIKLPPTIITLLGLDPALAGGWIMSGTHKGVKSLDFATIKDIYVHLQEVSTNNNAINGERLTRLDVVSSGRGRFGMIEEYRFEYPHFKPLRGCDIRQLRLSLCDSNNRPIDNHGLEVTATLEVVMK